MEELNRDWIQKAACLGSYDPRFFPKRGDSNKEVKAICYNECDVREECLEWALSRSERFGIWGGTSERDRQAIRKRRNAQARELMIRNAKETKAHQDAAPAQT